MTDDSPVMLNLGAGKQVIEGFLSVDLAEGADIHCDIVRLAAFADCTVDVIMGIHVFEHLYRWDAVPALQEWLRVLKPGGRIILELPDLAKCCANILAGAEDRMGLWGLHGDPVYRDPLMVHKWCYTSGELGKLLREAGFSKPKVKPVQYHKKQRDMRLEAVKP